MNDDQDAIPTMGTTSKVEYCPVTDTVQVTPPNEEIITLKPVDGDGETCESLDYPAQECYFSTTCGVCDKVPCTPRMRRKSGFRGVPVVWVPA